MSRATGLLIHREYTQMVKRKSFLIGTLLTPLFFVLIFVLPKFFLDRQTEVQTVAVADASGFVYEGLKANLEAVTLKSGEARYAVEPLDTDEESLAAALARVQDKKLRAVLVIPEDIATTNKAELRMRSATEFLVQNEISGALSSVVRLKRMADRGLDPAEMGAMMASTSLDVKGVEDEKERDVGAIAIASFIFVFLLYMTLITYGTTILNGVVEDKTSRVYEVMLSSATARDILLGKVVGTCLAAVTQYAIWFAMAAALHMVRPIEQLQNFDLGLGMALSLGMIFVLGLLIYSLLFAGLGAICSSTQDAQHVMWPVLMFLIFPMVLLTPIMASPDGGLARGLSLFPMTAPIVMPLRIGATDPSAVELAACFLLMAVFAWAVHYVAGKVFRIAIMLHGKRPEWGTVLRWIRESES